MTYEEWWAYEGKRRRERPYTPQTSIRYVMGWCDIHKDHICNCGKPWKDGEIPLIEKSIIVRTPYA